MRNSQVVSRLALKEKRNWLYVHYPLAYRFIGFHIISDGNVDVSVIYGLQFA